MSVRCRCPRPNCRTRPPSNLFRSEERDSDEVFSWMGSLPAWVALIVLGLILSFLVVVIHVVLRHSAAGRVTVRVRWLGLFVERDTTNVEQAANQTEPDP